MRGSGAVMLTVCGVLLLQGCPTTTTTTTTTTSTTTSTIAPGDLTPPSVPAGVTATPSGCGAVLVAWTASTDVGGSGLAAYDLYRDGVAVRRVNAPATSATDAGVPAGAHGYRVSALDGAGNRSAQSAQASVTVAGCGQAPVASAGPDVFTQTLTAVSLSGSGSSDPDGTIAAWSWAFGDGAQASGVSVSHTWATAGTFTVTLTVTDNGGLTATDTAVVHVTNRAPVANAGADASTTPGAPLTLDGRASSDPDGTVVSHAWSFGDGATATGATTSHAWTAPGTYTVTLTVTDDRGAQATDTATVTVNARWSRRFGSTGDDRVQALAVDAAGNVAVTGLFSGTVDFGGGPFTSVAFAWLDPLQYKDAFVVRYDAGGAHLWSRQIGAEADDRGIAIAAAPGGDVVVTGSVASDVDFGDGTLTSTQGLSDAFVARYAAADGRLVWARRMSSSGNEAGAALAVDASGAVVVAGGFQGTVDFGGGPLTAAGGGLDQDVFVAKYAADGTYVWSKRFGAAATFDYVGALALDGSGNVLLAGSFYGQVGFGGPVLASAGGYDAFVAKLGPTGVHVWSKRYGGTEDDAVLALASNAAGTVTATGTFRGTVDFGGGALASAGGQDAFVLQLSSAGAHRWSRRAGAASDDSARSVALDANGHAVVTGAFSGTVDFGGGGLAAVGGGDLFVARYDGTTGAHLASRRHGGTGYQYGQAAAVQPSGNLVLGGYAQNTIDFGSGVLTSAGSWDGVVASVLP